MDDFEITQPTPEELRALIKKHDLTREEAASLVHASKRALNNWVAKESNKGFRKVPLAAYELLLLKVGEHPGYKTEKQEVTTSDFEQPTPEDIRALVKRHDLTRGEAAALVHASKRTWDNWSAKEDARDFRKMPLAVYELILIKLGEHKGYKSSI